MLKELPGFGRIEMAGATDRGLVRAANEDAHLVLQGGQMPAWCRAVAAVFDGVGGGPHGGEASRRAADYLRQAIEALSQQMASPLNIEETVGGLVRELNQKLCVDWRTFPALRGMSTTATVALLVRTDPPKLVIGHVGDSPAFRVRRGRIEKLVQEDSVVAELVRTGLITEEEALHHPRRHVITQALGHVGEVTPHVRSHTVDPDDCFLLCTDGLTNLAPVGQIQEVLLAQAPETACRELIDAAKAAGGTDNITVVVLKFTPTA